MKLKLDALWAAPLTTTECPPARPWLHCLLPLPCLCLQVPKSIMRTDGMPLGPKYHEGLGESEFLAMFKEMAGKNKV